MGFTLKLIVHGVPMGHKTWGATDADYKYIKGFYGASSQVAERLVVEVQSINNQTLCYYTYIKGANVHASDGRPGAYIALTLCANAYYADVQNIYSILHATYTKMGIGSLTQVVEGIHKFCIDDFAKAERQLKEMEQQIIQYIGTYSNDDDLIGLDTFSNGKSAPSADINLHECQRDTALAQMKLSHRIVVSPHFPSQHFANELRLREAELQSVKQQSQQQLHEMQRQQDAAFAKAHEEISQLQQAVAHLQQENATLRKNQKAAPAPASDDKQKKEKPKKGLLARLLGRG